MAIYQTQCTIFKYNLLAGLEDFNPPSSYTYKIALYTSNASLSSATTAYSTTNEITGTGYTVGGLVLTPSIALDNTANAAYVTFNNVTWNPANFSTAGALIYNSTTGAAVAVLNFGQTITAINTFTITFPTASASSAVIRIN